MHPFGQGLAALYSCGSSSGLWLASPTAPMSSWCPPLPLAFLSSTFPQPPLFLLLSLPGSFHLLWRLKARDCVLLVLCSPSPSFPTPNISHNRTKRLCLVHQHGVCTPWNNTWHKWKLNNICWKLMHELIVYPQKDSGQQNAGALYYQPVTTHILL